MVAISAKTVEHLTAHRKNGSEGTVITGDLIHVCIWRGRAVIETPRQRTTVFIVSEKGNAEPTLGHCFLLFGYLPFRTMVISAAKRRECRTQEN
jgi:hypothetical protein